MLKPRAISLHSRKRQKLNLQDHSQQNHQNQLQTSLQLESARQKQESCSRPSENNNINESTKDFSRKFEQPIRKGSAATAAQENAYGNYASYYRRRNNHCVFAIDPRLMLIPASVVDGKRVLDIGCNSGDVSIALAQVFSPIEVVGVDLDLSLIAKARKNLANKASVVGSDENEFGESTVLEKDYFPITSYLMFGPAPIIYDGDSDTKLSGDPMSKRSGNHAGNFFPQNVSFRASNFLTDPLLMTEKDKFDTILALSITKWIHVNHGDSGIKLFFQKCWNALRKGGVLILEPQSWEGDGYSRAFSKTGGSGSQGKALSSAMKDKKTGMRNLTLELHPDEFPTYLLDVVGFSDCEKLGETWNAARGFRREVFQLRK